MVRVGTDRRGITIVELIVTLSILSILATLILPSAQMTGRRMKEVELRRDLRIIRSAIDEFKKSSDKVPMPPTKSGYPETLEQLVEGTDFLSQAAKAEKKKFLRRIPFDPFNPAGKGGKPEWGLRSYADRPDSTIWGGDDVFDVYSLSDGTAIDGTKYKDW